MADANKKEEWLYYYALRHMLAHWSAMMTMIGLLATVWLAVAFYANGRLPARALTPIALVYLVSLYFR